MHLDFVKYKEGKWKIGMFSCFGSLGLKNPLKMWLFHSNLLFKQNVKWSQRLPQGRFVSWLFGLIQRVSVIWILVKKTKKEKIIWIFSPDFLHRKAADIWSAGMHKEILFFLAFFFLCSLFYGGFLNLSHSHCFCFATRGTCRLVLSLEQSLLRHSFFI